MGTTLTNGIYLPNEGEKNCYAGLKTNWETLDQKIADITALQQAVAGALHREIVASLPTTDIDPNTIYMILSGTSATENVYNEFMYVNNAWELIGTSATDLTNYYTKGDVDGLLVLKANASDLTSHTGDTTIHVTASDKSKWNTVALIKQLRLVNAQVGSATTIAFANIDDTNGIKVGDKCMDLDGRMFEITAVDTANQTVTVGTALIDLALDANVVHTSGNETVSGQKTFSSDIILQGTTTPVIKTISNIVQDSTGNNDSISWVIRDKTDSNTVFAQSVNKFSGQSVDWRCEATGILNGTSTTKGINLVVDPVNEAYRFTSRGNNTLDLGSSTNRWKSVYAYSYYYGSDNVEFSTKFVTSDTAQTISGGKIFAGNVTIYNSDTSVDTRYLILRNQKVKRGSTTETGVQFITFHDKDGGTLVSYETNVLGSGNTQAYINVSNLDVNSQRVVGGVKIIKTPTETWFIPNNDNTVSSGLSNSKWKDVNTYLVNGLTPSSLGMPVIDRTKYVDISGYFTNTGTGEFNTYPVTANGWIFLRLSTISSCQISVVDSNSNLLYGTTSSGGIEQILVPVIAGTTFQTQWATVSAVVVATARFIPCQGNI